MREFIFYSANAVTAGNFIGSNLKDAGRMDIVCNTIIQALFISNDIRRDVKLHLVLDGPPNAPKHLLFDTTKNAEDMPISKKDIAGLIKRMLYKSPEKEGLKEIYPGCLIERKSLEHVVKDLAAEGKNVFLLDEGGEDIRDVEIKENFVFVLGDHEGFPNHKRKFLKRIDKVSVGPKVLFASQVFVILNNEIDRQE